MNPPVLGSSAAVALAGATPEGVRLVVICLIGLLLVVLGFLLAHVLLLRRKPVGEAAAPREDVEPTASSEPPLDEPMVAPMPVMSAVGSAEGVAVEPGTTSLACPTCRRKYEGDLVFCPNDARRLVPASEMLLRARRSGGVCPRCRRAFDPRVRACPHDGTELVPAAVYETTRAGGLDASPTGVLAKICPLCRKRYDLAATFCGRDGNELRTLN